MGRIMGEASLDGIGGRASPDSRLTTRGGRPILDPARTQRITILRAAGA